MQYFPFASNYYLFPNLSFKKKFSLFFQIRQVLQEKFYRYHLNIYHQMQKFTNILFPVLHFLYNFSPPFTQQWDSPMAKETDQTDNDWLVTTIEQFDFCPASEQTSIFSNIGSSNLIPRQEFRMGLGGSLVQSPTSK